MDIKVLGQHFNKAVKHNVLIKLSYEATLQGKYFLLNF